MGEEMKQEIEVPVKVDWKGGKLVEAQIREFNIIMDLPSHEKKGEKSLGPSATETFLAALGRCTLISIVRAAENKQVPIKKLSLKLTGKLKKKVYEAQNPNDSTWIYYDIDKNLDISTPADKRTVTEIIRESHKFCTVGLAVEAGILGSFKKITINNS